MPDVETEPYALTTKESLKAWLGDEAWDERAAVDAINGVSELMHLYMDRQLVPTEDGMTKRFQYDGDGILDLRGTELRAATAITVYSDMPASQQVVLSAGDVNNEASYRLYDLRAQGAYLSLLLPRLTVRTLTSSEYALDPLDKPIEIAIAGNWGAGVIPGAVRMACNVAAAEAYGNPEAAAERSVGASNVDQDEDDDWSFGLSKRVRRMLREFRR